MPGERISVLCRPARPADTPDVMELTRTIWEGRDYVPSVWADWLADPDGFLAVAQYEGRVVGLGRLTRLTSRDWWLEGLRTHPQFEGRGVASSLHTYLLGIWQQTIGNSVLRLATASFRLPVQHLAESTGFLKVGEFTPYRAPSIAGTSIAKHFRRITAGEAQAALDRANSSPTLDLAWGLMDLGWEWCRPNLTSFLDTIHAGQAWWWRDKYVLLAREDDDEEDEHLTLQIQLLACTPEIAADCLQDFRGLAASLGYPDATWVAPMVPALQAALQKAGFERSWDAFTLVYARSR